jgi:hypothetical protein
MWVTEWPVGERGLVMRVQQSGKSVTYDLVGGPSSV